MIGHFTRCRRPTSGWLTGILGLVSLFLLLAITPIGRLQAQDQNNIPSLLAWRPDGKVLAMSGNFGLRLYTRELANLPPLEDVAAAVYAIAWSPDGQKIAGTDLTGAVKVWDIVTGKRTNVLSGHRDIATGVSWSPDGSKIASSSTDQTVRIWDARTGNALMQIPHTGKVWAVHLRTLCTVADFLGVDPLKLFKLAGYVTSENVYSVRAEYLPYLFDILPTDKQMALLSVAETLDETVDAKKSLALMREAPENPLAGVAYPEDYSPLFAVQANLLLTDGKFPGPAEL